MYRERAYTWLGAQPASNHQIADLKWARRTSVIIWPGTLSNQRAVRHADGRNAELGTKLQRQPCTTWMITSRGVQ
jgi:hypothetical protein